LALIGPIPLTALARRRAQASVRWNRFTGSIAGLRPPLRSLPHQEGDGRRARLIL